MNTILKTLIAAGIVASFNFNALAADAAAPSYVQDHLQRMERMKSMTPEQRAERRKAVREYLDKMSPEERAIHHAERRKRWDSMTPEQRAERRKEMREPL